MRSIRLAVIAALAFIAASAFATVPVVTFTTTGTTVSESAGSVALHLQRNAADVVTTVTFSVYNYTATSPSDYGPVPASVTFNIGESTKDLVIPIVNDNFYENTEEFEVYLSTITNGTSGYPYYSYVDITDDDPAALIDFTSPSYVVNENAGPVNVTVTRSNNTQIPVSVSYSTSDGTAHLGTDYTSVSGTLNFAAGETSKTVPVPITNDGANTGSRYFAFNINNASSGALISRSSANVNIVDDDPPTYIQFASNHYDVNEGAGSVTITVTRSGNTAVTSSVSYQTSNGSAQPGFDFTNVAGTLTFAPGETSKTFSVPIIDDAVQEYDEYFQIYLNGVTGATFGSITGTQVVIADNELPSIVSVSMPARVGEKDGAVTATITRSGNLAVTTVVSYQTTSNTTCCFPPASPASDFTPVSGTATFNPGETSKTIPIPILDDAIYEGDESFGFALGAVQSGVFGSPTQVTTIITDDEAAPVISFSAQTYRVAENAGTLAVTLTRQGSTAGQSSIYFQTGTTFYGSASPGTDYLSVSGTFTFAAGETSKTISIPILDDTLFEGDETLGMSLYSPVNAIVGISSATATIVDDEPDVTVGLDTTSFTATEGDGSIVIPVRRSSGTGTVTLTYSTSTGSASALDFTPVIGTLTFAPGETLKSISIPINDDSFYEPTESFYLNLTSITGARGGITAGTITLRDNDPAPALTINDVTIAEGDSGTRSANFTVSLSAPLQQGFTFGYAVRNGTATNGDDFLAPSFSSVTFNAGDVSKTITVQIFGDTTPEPDETFYVVFNPLNADPAAGLPHIMKPAGTGTIVNDDAAFSISSDRVIEGKTTQVTVRLSPAQIGPASVDYTTSAGTATAGSDYTPLSGTLHFAAGETAKKIEIPTTDDAVPETDETFFVRLSNANGAQLASSEATVTILDNDEAYSTYDDVQYASPDGYPLTLDLSVPNGAATPVPVVLWIPGDNWTGGLKTPNPAQHELARGYAVASIEIRPSEVAHFPAQIFDAKAAVRWLRANAAQYNLDPQRIAVWGFGSGAHIASLLGTSGNVAALEDPSEGNAAFSSSVRAVVDWAGPADVSQLSADALACSTQNFDSSGSYLSIFLGCTAKSCPAVAEAADPTHYITANDPPFLIMHGDSDCEVAPAQSQSFARALKAGHVDARFSLIADGGHTGAFWDGAPVLNVVDAFLDEVLVSPGRRRSMR